MGDSAATVEVTSTGAGSNALNPKLRIVRHYARGVVVTTGLQIIPAPGSRTRA